MRKPLAIPRQCAFMTKKMTADGRLDQATFVDACKADVYTARKNDEGAPLKECQQLYRGPSEGPSHCLWIDERCRPQEGRRWDLAR